MCTQRVFSTKKSLTSSRPRLGTRQRRRRGGRNVANVTSTVPCDGGVYAYRECRMCAPNCETQNVARACNKSSPLPSVYATVNVVVVVNLSNTHQLSSLISSSGFLVLLSAWMRNACGYSESTCSN